MNLVLLMNFCISPMLQYSEISGFSPNALKHLNKQDSDELQNYALGHTKQSSPISTEIDTHRLKVWPKPDGVLTWVGSIKVTPKCLARVTYRVEGGGWWLMSFAEMKNLGKGGRSVYGTKIVQF